MTLRLQAPAAPRVVRRDPARPAVPRATTSIILAVAVVASLAPSLLPRSSLTQAIVTGVFATAGLAVSALLHRLCRSVVNIRPNIVARQAFAVVSAVSVAAAAVVDIRWQNGLRDAMGSERTSTFHWVEVACGSVSVCAVLVVIGVALCRGTLRLGLVRAAALGVAAAGVVHLVVVPMAWDSLSSRFAASDAYLGSSPTIPLSLTRSGSTASSIAWDALGREGRKFVAGGNENEAVRTYVGLHSAPTLHDRADAAVTELDRAGGFTKAHMVLAIPTGSGWVDENAVSGIEERFDGDVATVALQYSVQPSWATFLFARSEAEDSAAALLDAVRTRIDALPEFARPDLYVYGQSLGSVGGSSAVADRPGAVCAALWAGPPAGEVVEGQAVVLANSSDPVVRWSTDLITTAPDLSSTRTDAPVPQWIPVVSYLQTTVDMVSALGAPAGHGHRYGTDQGTSLPECWPTSAE